MIRSLDQSSGFPRSRAVAKLTRDVAWLTARGRRQEASEVLVQGMSSLGGVYIKFLQIIANLIPDFPGLKPEITDTIYDSHSYQDVDIIDTLGRNLAPHSLARISNISAQPFASGSFAQVYEATLDQQQKVIIKVLRPHIKRQLKTDLRLLSILARAVQPLIRSDILSTVRVYKDYKRTVLQEINYRKEVAFAKEMYRLHAHNIKVVVPETYDELSTDEIIVQEKIEGIPVSKLLAETAGNGAKTIEIIRNNLNSDVIEQLSEFGFDLICSSIEGPYMYGDPHPGNIILMSDNRVGIIDFGVLLPGITNPHDLYEVLTNEGEMHYDQTGNTNIAEHILKVFRLYNPKVFTALERIDQELKSISLVHELTGLIDKLIEPSKERIRESYRKGIGIPTKLIMESINGQNQPNRFSIMAYEPTARITRAQSQFWNFLEQLGIARETSMEVHRKLRERFAAGIQSYKKQEEMTYTDASQIVIDWFTELMERDPLLFEPLFAKIRKTLQDYEKEPSNA